MILILIGINVFHMMPLNKIIIPISKGFQVEIPGYIVIDPDDNIMLLDTKSKDILISLLLNDYVADSSLYDIAKSYASIIHTLRKSGQKFFIIRRIRKTGYNLCRRQ